ncbi:MAG: cytochrome c family protein [Planctomycetota bacterium]
METRQAMKRLQRLTLATAGLLGFLTLLLGASLAQEEKPQEKAPPKYVGVASCKKCHLKSSIGKQFKIWEESKHAKAFELLKSEESAAVAKKAGLEAKPFEAPECLRCHTTAWGLDKKLYYGEKFSLEDGVTCEACHGAGEFFAKPADEHLHKEAADKGYIKPDEKLCRGCHNEESPTWNPEADTTEDGAKVGFDYKSRLKTIAHSIPEEGEGEGKE